MTTKMNRSRQISYRYRSRGQRSHRRNVVRVFLQRPEVRKHWPDTEVRSETTHWRYELLGGGGEPVTLATQLDAPPLGQYLIDSAEELRHRLANANDYFRRKASEVLNDDLSLRLLATLYQATVVNISELDTCEYGIALSKLTAANFCEIGADVIYITKAGRQFIAAIKNA